MNTFFKAIFAASVIVTAGFTTLGLATPIEVSSPRAAVPPNVVTTSNRPMIMLAATKDHSLFGPIYTDFEDLDDDGQIDTTFKPTFRYYGYFDPVKCYAYSTTDARFNPVAAATVTGGRFTCSSAQSYWSGNFLNWSTMTRLDTVRKMLYGGNRSTDANGTTVLQASKLVRDAHSFVKYYRGNDIRDYTPFTTAALTKPTGSNANVYAGLSICTTGSSNTPTTTQPVMRMVKGNVRFWSTVEIELCRWRDTDGYTQGTFGPKLAAYYNDADKGNGGIKHEITIPSSNIDGAVYNNIGPDLNIRVKVCDSSMLGSERCQPFPSTSTTNYKPFGLLQEFGYANAGAARAEFGLMTGSYDRNHTAGALRKNMGDFADEIHPTTGVFCHSPSAGCATTLADGRTTGNGAIKALDSFVLFGRNGNSYGGGNTPSASGEGNLPAWGNPIGEMLVQALQYYSYNGTSPTPSNPASTTNDVSVGLPIATWRDPLSNTNATRTNLYGNSMCRPLHNLVLASSALSFDGQAGTPFTTLRNSSAGLDSFTNVIGSNEGIHGSIRSVGSVTGTGLTTADDTNSCSAKTVGTLAQVNGICPEAPAMGGTYQIAGAALYANTTRIRPDPTPKPADFEQVEGVLKVRTLAASLTGGSPRIDVPIPGSSPVKYVYITPESVQGGGKVSAPLTFASINAGPTFGSFMVTWNDILMGGDYDMDITGFLRYDLIANAATPSGWDIKITTDIPGVCGGAAGTHGFSVIGVQQAGVSANGRYLTHQHNSTPNNNNPVFEVLGGMPPVSEYRCGDPSYRNRNDGFGLFSNSVCNVTGNLAGVGNSGDPGFPALPKYCTVKNVAYPVATTFQMVGETNALLKDPLWYAAKYGYFNSNSKNADNTYTNVALPPDQLSWDNLRADGTNGSDGVPDGYFLARRPDVLEAQLRRALSDVAGQTNASPSTSAPAIIAGEYRYDVNFNVESFDGNLEAFKVNSSGGFETAPDWRAGQLLGCRTKGPCAGVTADSGDSRQIITNNGNGTGAGVRFRWASLPTAYRTQLTTAGTNVLSAANAEIAVNYVRGDQTNESATQLRDRGSNVLGPVISSTPWLQTPPAANYFGTAFRAYTAFAAANKDRPKLVWLGANDGMLHAFNPSTGREEFAYVPGALANRLGEIPLQKTGGATRIGGAAFVTGTEVKPDGTLWPYVDGSPFTGDVRLGLDTAAVTAANWKTYVFGSLGRGGRGVFALDATSVSTLQNAEAGAGAVFKWQFTLDDDADLGHIVNDFATSPSSRQPMPIAKMNNGKFAYVIGNGYKSKDGRAVLYILFADGPTGVGGAWQSGVDYIKIVADVGANNGLSQVTWIDLDGNGTADSLYAGDLRGNMWKFNVKDGAPSNWDVAYKAGGVNKSLFTAKGGANGDIDTQRLAITTAPLYVFGPFDGPVIFFATGNAFETSDFPSTLTNRIYGIWDRPAFASAGRALPTTLSTLASRVFARDATGNVSVSSAASLNFATQDGWYATLPGTSEMVLADPAVRASQFIFTTVRPPTTGAYCTSRPDASLFILDTLLGTPTRNNLGKVTVSGITTNYVGVASADQKVKVVADRTGTAFKPKGPTCIKGSPGCAENFCVGNVCSPTPPTCGNGQRAPRVVGPNTDKTLCFDANPRLQWRDIPGIRTDR